MYNKNVFTICIFVLSVLLYLNSGCKREKAIHLDAEADACIRSDLDIRRNDNYGCQEFMVIGTSREGKLIGRPDAMRALVRFELAEIPSKSSIKEATLELTVHSFDSGSPSSVYTVNVHRVVDSGSRTPWSEGNGSERSPQPSGCVWVDDASGVAWLGAGDGGDDNNQTQPDFDPAVIANATVNQATHKTGDMIQWDITALVQDWVNQTHPNHGVVLKDPTTDGSFRGVRFGAREGNLHSIPGAVNGPRLVVTFVPK